MSITSDSMIYFSEENLIDEISGSMTIASKIYKINPPSFQQMVYITKTPYAIQNENKLFI